METKLRKKTHKMGLFLGKKCEKNHNINEYNVMIFKMEVIFMKVKERVKNLMSDLFPYMILLGIVFLVNMFVAQLTLVNGDSMYPYLKNKQLLVINKTAHYIGEYDRDDIVVIWSDELNRYIIKRVIGLPGETIQIKEGSVYINGEKLEEKRYYDSMISAGNASEPIILGEDEYFVLGDNRNNSSDSRVFGPFQPKDIQGNILFSLWPIKSVR